MSIEPGEQPREPSFGPLAAKSWLVQTGRMKEEKNRFTVNMPLDGLGRAALGIMAGEQPPVLSQAYERVAEVATISRELIAGIVRDAVEPPAAEA